MSAEITSTATTATVPAAPTGSARVEYPKVQTSSQYTVVAHQPTPRKTT